MADKNFIVKNGLEVGGQEVVSSSGVVTSAALGGQTLASIDSPTFNNLTLTNDISVGGDINLTGDLNITGDVNSLSVTDLDVTDQTITLGAGQVESASGGSGIIVDGSNASILWDETNTEWDFNNNINVTGTVTADGLTVDGTNGSFTVGSTGNDFYYSRNGANYHIANTTSGSFNFLTGASSLNRLKISATGDISFYEDTGTTAKFFWDASEEKLGIGTTSSIDQKLTLVDTADVGIKMLKSGSVTTTIRAVSGAMAFGVDGGSGTTERMRISSGGDISFYEDTGTTAKFFWDASEERLGIGVTNPQSKLDVEAGALGSTSGDSTTAAILRAGRQNLVFKDTRTADGNDWNNATFKIIAQIDSTNHQSIDFVNDNNFLEHIDIRTGNQVFHSRFTSGGNLGIGTTSPAVKLAVSNNGAEGIELIPSGGGEPIIQSYNRSGAAFTSLRVTASDLKFYAGSSPTERMRIDSSGKVIIKTDYNSPQLSTMSYGDWGNLPLQLQDSSLTNTAGYVVTGIGFGYSSETTAAIVVTDEGGSAAQSMSFITGTNTGAVPRMTIDQSGNVGIGTTNPQAKLNTNLQVEGSILAYMSGTSLTFDGGKNVAVTHSSSALGTGTAGGLLLANNNNSNGAPSPLIAFSARSASSSYNHTYATIHGEKTSSGADTNWNTGALIFSTGSGTGPNERMRINSSGQVLIGTSTNPTYNHKLVASGNACIDGVLRVEDIDSTVALSNAVLGLAFPNDADATSGYFVYMTDGNGAIGSISVASGTSVSFNTTSDERLKKNIVDASSQLDTIKNIKVREFDWNKNDYHEVGVIAQEIINVVPNVVQEGGDDVTKHPFGVDYGKIVPYLIKAIQEQQTIIDDLKSRLDEAGL